MLHQVHEGLYVGDEGECRLPGEPMEWAAVLHCAKDPCHRRLAGGYTGRALPATHPDYLSVRRGVHLALNIIDPPAPLFRREVFQQALDFLDEMQDGGDLLLHCNEGRSRAPAIALLYLAKRRGVLPDSGYAAAAEAFTRERMASYEPGIGIRMFLEITWPEIK